MAMIGRGWRAGSAVEVRWSSVGEDHRRVRVRHHGTGPGRDQTVRTEIKQASRLFGSAVTPRRGRRGAGRRRMARTHSGVVTGYLLRETRPAHLDRCELPNRGYSSY